MRRLAAAVLAALIALPALAASTPPALAAGCAALGYQVALVAASASLQQTPPDVSTAQRDVAALLQRDPTSAVALQPVLDDLSTAPPLLDDARLRLTSMSATLVYPPGSTCGQDASAARGTLHGVYSSPAFRHLDDVSQPGFLDGLLRALGDALSRAAGSLGTGGAVLIILCVLGLAALIVWRRLRGSAALRGAAIEEPATSGDDPEAEWSAALRAAAAGDHREAVRRAFRSALLEVAVRGRVRIDAAWTTRELLERCHADGDVLVALASAAAVFDRAWYSGNPVTEADWTLAAERCGTLRRLTGHTRVTAP